MTKQEKGAALFALGYRAALRGPNVLIRNPEGKLYLIDPQRGTCSCQGFVTHKTECCHLLGYLDLMLDVSLALSVRAHERLECVRGCWNYDEAGMVLACRASALSARAGRLQERAWEVLRVVEGRADTERREAA